jgi:hypothetical protein
MIAPELIAVATARKHAGDIESKRKVNRVDAAVAVQGAMPGVLPTPRGVRLSSKNAQRGAMLIPLGWHRHQVYTGNSFTRCTRCKTV